MSAVPGSKDDTCYYGSMEKDFEYYQPNLLTASLIPNTLLIKEDFPTPDYRDGSDGRSTMSQVPYPTNTKDSEPKSALS
jgi:hypothetical protein